MMVSDLGEFLLLMTVLLFTFEESGQGMENLACSYHGHVRPFEVEWTMEAEIDEMVEETMDILGSKKRHELRSTDEDVPCL